MRVDHEGTANLTAEEIEGIEVDTTVLNGISAFFCVCAWATTLLVPSQKKKEWPANIASIFMSVAFLYHINFLLGAFVGYEEIRADGTICKVQGVIQVYLAHVLLYLVALMNLNLYATICWNQPEYVKNRQRRCLVFVFFTPLINAAIGSVAVGPEVSFCWVSIHTDWYFVLLGNLGAIIVYSVCGTYWWASVCIKIFRIYREVVGSNSSATGEPSIAFAWFNRFKRQLFWILVNMYLFVLLIAGFVVFFERPPSYYFSISVVLTLSSIGWMCFFVLFATAENWSSFRAGMIRFTKKSKAGGGGGGGDGNDPLIDGNDEGPGSVAAGEQQFSYNGGTAEESFGEQAHFSVNNNTSAAPQNTNSGNSGAHTSTSTNHNIYLAI